VEFGEIEAVLATHEAVAIAVVAAKDTDGQRTISAFVTMRPERSADARELCMGESARYMVRRRSAVGICRSRLAARSIAPPALGACRSRAMQPGVRATQDEGGAVAGGYLGGSARSKVGSRQFLRSRGHSLLATQLISRLHDRHGIDVPLRLLFEASTIEHRRTR
jgi:hypothetical protein